MSGCDKCHETGKVTCTKCGGEKEVECEKCNGHGRFKNCSECDSTGKIACPSCNGSGKSFSVCPVCQKGYVWKTRLINCKTCYGRGYYTFSDGSRTRCPKCDGTGQREDPYQEICPNCHGDYKREVNKPCKECKGTGEIKCSRCGGSGHARCQECNGSGKVKCDKCSGKGSVKCPDCERRERDARELRERKEREERNRQIEEQRKKEAAESAAKDRNEKILGCGCLLAIVATVGFFVWWWIEGMTAPALSDMWANAKSFAGGSGKVVLWLFALFVIWKLLKALVTRKKAKSSSTSASPKKRWKFVVLGLFLGFVGAHLAYAKRWVLFLLLWACLVTTIVLADSDSDSRKHERLDAQVQVVSDPNAKQTDKSPSVALTGVGCTLTWLALWLGGAIFIKKDGNGNRM